jgi:NADH:ubiquinone oxidoreductase subunit K
MLILSLITLLFGIILNRNNFIVIIMILELIYLLLGFLLIFFENPYFIIYIFCVTAAETAIGLSLLLGYFGTLR